MEYHNFIGYGIPIFFTFYSTSYEPRKKVGEQRDWLWAGCHIKFPVRVEILLFISLTIPSHKVHAASSLGCLNY